MAVYIILFAIGFSTVIYLVSIVFRKLDKTDHWVRQGLSADQKLFSNKENNNKAFHLIDKQTVKDHGKLVG